MAEEIIPIRPWFSQSLQSSIERLKHKRGAMHKIRASETFRSGLDRLSVYHLYLVLPISGRIYDVTDSVESITYSYDFDTPYTQMQVNFYSTTNMYRFLKPGNWLALFGPYYNNADTVRTFDENGELKEHFTVPETFSQFEEIDRAQIVSVDAEVGDQNSITVTAKDPTWILAKSVMPWRLPTGTLAERLRFIEGRGFLRLRENLIDTRYELPATRAGNSTVWENIQLDLGETNLKLSEEIQGKLAEAGFEGLLNRPIDQVRFVVRHRKGEYYIQEITIQHRHWAFEVGNNIMGLTRHDSIEEFYNEINVISTGDDLFAQFSGVEEGVSLKETVTGFAEGDQRSLQRYGRHVLTVEEEVPNDPVAAQKQAEKLLKRLNKVHSTANLTTYSLTGLRWGDQIVLYDPTVDVSGIYWIRGGKHTIQDGIATMALDIEFEALAPEAMRQEQIEDDPLRQFTVLGQAEVEE